MGLLAIFFFVVGLELKESVAGRLRDPRRAALPIAAAVGGVVVPALIFVLINAGSGADALRGWAIPTATDIAFAVAVIAVVGKFLPALRVFLLTLAIIDDLIAITIIATFYTDSISFPWLILALLPLAGFAALVAKGVRAWWLLLPLAIAVWVCIHASGVHATVAGVLLGFVVPVTATERARVRTSSDDEGLPVYDGMAAHFADRWSVVATLFAVPVFAFFAAGVTVGGWDGLPLRVLRPDHDRDRRRTRRRQADRHPCHDLPAEPIPRTAARRDAALAGSDRYGLPRRNRLHRLPAGGRTRLRVEFRGGRACEDRSARRILRRRDPGWSDPRPTQCTGTPRA